MIRHSQWIATDGRCFYHDARLAIIDDRDTLGKAILRAARTAVREGDLGRNRQARREAALKQLRELLADLPMSDLNALAVMWMISNKWCGATGQGGIWAAASELVNTEARAVSSTRLAFVIE